MNKDIERVVVRTDKNQRSVFEGDRERDIMTTVGNMEGIDVVSVQFKDGEVVNYTSKIYMCDMGEIHKGVSAPNIHMSSCLTKEEAIKEIKELIGGEE